MGWLGDGSHRGLGLPGLNGDGLPPRTPFCILWTTGNRAWTLPVVRRSCTYVCIGCRCTIDWKPGMNVTEKKVKKTQQHRTNPGAKRTVIKTIQNKSFFNFFSPPEGIDQSVHLPRELCLNPFKKHWKMSTNHCCPWSGNGLGVKWVKI